MFSYGLANLAGALDSVKKHMQESEAAEARVNASISDPESLVEQSASLRNYTESMMNETKEDFQRKQDEHTKVLDDLAGQLETLDLSELSENVSLLFSIMSRLYYTICMMERLTHNGIDYLHHVITTLSYVSPCE